MATLKKTKTVAKSSLKSLKGKAAPAPSVKLKTTAKTAKTVAKSPPKGVSKKTAKTPIKVTAKESAKLISKVTPKSAAKPAPKPSPKFVLVPKVVSKAVSKAAETVVHKTVSKPVSKSMRSGILLTEAELVKQAKSEYMSKDQLAFFKNRLMQLQDQLRQNAGATTEHLRELAVAPDPADRATLEEEHALELRARDRERKLLKKVDAVLAMIDSGEYGYCEETGEPIGIPRLLARPTATLTIEAQERRELKQKMYGE